MQLNPWQQSAKSDALRICLLIAIGMIALIIVISVVFSMIDQAKQHPYQRKIETLWNDKSLTVLSESPVIRKPYTVYYLNNKGIWVYKTDKAERVTDPNTGEYSFIYPDYPDAVREVQDAKTVVLLRLDPSTSKKINNFKWTDGSIAYGAQLMMTVIDQTAHTRYDPVEFGKVLVNHKRDGLYQNTLLDASNGNGLDMYTRIMKYFK